MKSDIERMYKRIAKAERRIARKVRVEEETQRIARLKGILKELGQEA
jgi:hypothetical protein